MPTTRVRPPKPRERDLSRWPGVGVLVLVSAVFLGLQVSMTDYGENGVGAAVFWFVIGCWLLWLVHARRSRVARLLVGASGMAGAIIYGVGAVGDLDPHAALLALLFLGEALPLALPPVAAHVRPVVEVKPPDEPGDYRRPAAK